MRAAYYTSNGAAAAVLTVGEVATPEPGPGEVRVRLATSGVNPSDVKAREGRTRKIAWPRVIPHSDGAGVIDSVGAGVSESRIGERVWLWNGQWRRADGTCAEYIALPSAQAILLPDHISFAAGACLGIPAMTAYHALAKAQPRAGEFVLVSGGAGGVGHYAIQFAKARGATVVATISSAAKARLAREAGADHTIDYKTEDVGARIKAITAGRGVDAVIEMDFAANAKLLPALAAPHARVVVYGTGATESTIPTHFMLQNQLTVSWIFVYELTQAERDEAVGAIGQMLAERRLIDNVALMLPLDQIVAAHEAVEQGRTPGNVVVTLT